MISNSKIDPIQITQLNEQVLKLKLLENHCCWCAWAPCNWGTPVLRILSIRSDSSKCTLECWSTCSTSMNLLQIWHLAFVNVHVHGCSRRARDARKCAFASASAAIPRSYSSAGSGRAYWFPLPQLVCWSCLDARTHCWELDCCCSICCLAF